MPTATKSGRFDISLESETKKIAKKFSTILKKGDVVFLYGEIGVGKTTFIRNLINNFQKKNGIKLTEVTSPTFNLVNEYEVRNLKIEHYDLFRLKNYNDIKNIGLFENSADALTLIEWPEKIENKPKNRINLIFKYKKNLEKRFLTIKSLNKKYEFK